eukprot:7866763-Heterocapsa_arctica.AAC.1
MLRGRTCPRVARPQQESAGGPREPGWPWGRRPGKAWRGGSNQRGPREEGRRSSPTRAGRRWLRHGGAAGRGSWAAPARGRGVPKAGGWRWRPPGMRSTAAVAALPKA